MAKPKIAVLLSGSGVYDGSEIHEAVFTLLAIAEAGAEYQCVAPNVDQHHVINHTTGDEMNETRNVLVESARIARGDVLDIAEVKAEDYDALAMPGGFGAAKNLTTWAFNGPDGDINPEVKRLINEFVLANKPVAAMCMAPVVVAKALEGSGIQSSLTVGTTEEPSPYDIAAISGGMEQTGAVAEMVPVTDIVVDEENKIITSPCYMMEANIVQIHAGVELAIKKLVSFI